MIDLSNDELQTSFKRMKRISLLARAVMTVLTILSGTLAIWLSTKARRFNMGWSEITFIVLLSVACLCFICMFLWTVFLSRPFSKTMHAYVAEGYYSSFDFLTYTDKVMLNFNTVAFEMLFVGDKLTVILEDTGIMVQFDLTCVKSYPAVCSEIIAFAKKFLLAYCALHADIAKRDCEVKITSSVGGRPRMQEYIVTADGEMNPFIKRSYFIKHGLIK